MAEFNKDLIKHLTKLCRIDCSDEEQEELLLDLKKIIAHIEQLQEVDTKNVRPCNHVLEGMTNVWREDEVGEVMPREQFLSNAPSHVGGMIRVPPVLKNQ